MFKKLLALSVLLFAVRAHALDYSMGLGTPLEMCRWGGNDVCGNFNGVSYAITADFLSQEILGHHAHMLSLGGVALGMNDSNNGNKYFSFGVMLATLEKAVGLVVGMDAYRMQNGVETGLIRGPTHVGLSNFFSMITYTVNFTFGAPPIPATEEEKKDVRQKSKLNTVYINFL